MPEATRRQTDRQLSGTADGKLSRQHLVRAVTCTSPNTHPNTLIHRKGKQLVFVYNYRVKNMIN